jgi:uncharacterized protein YdaU (DUF1376 family)
MNYYERHLGDYAKDTAHLSMLEHGAYSLLLDRYYSTEAGIPEDQAHRVARAKTRDEKSAVDSILREFFILTDGIWINRRADEEIIKAHARIDSAKANGKLGGRPRKNPTITQQKPTGFIPVNPELTGSKALHVPSIKTKTPLPPKGGDDPTGFPEFWAAWPASPRKQDRKKCAAKWKRNGFDSKLPDILAHVDAMKTSRQWSEGFEPAPLTYLNGERWADGAPVHTNGSMFEGCI